MALTDAERQKRYRKRLAKQHKTILQMAEELLKKIKGAKYET